MTSSTVRKKKPLLLRPDDHGKRMSLAVFDRLDSSDGRIYELNKGVIDVGEIPSRQHAIVVLAIQRQFFAYDHSHPGVIQHQGGGSDAKSTIASFESQRHPDWSIYTTPMPEVDQPWGIYIPTIVIEVVSPSSTRRDYEDKPAEYLAIGVMEYWIIDPIKSQALVLTNKGGLWERKTYTAGKKIKSIRLPKFSFDLRLALKAAKR